MSATVPTPTAEQEQRARWDLLLLDLEYRAEQLRQLKRYEPWKLVISAVTGTTVVLAAIAGGIVWLLHAAGVLH